MEYVDLGLPSGTMWAKESLKDDGVNCLLTFDEANMLCIPSAEQWEELLTYCKWRLIDNLHATVTAKCVKAATLYAARSFTRRKEKNARSIFAPGSKTDLSHAVNAVSFRATLYLEPGIPICQKKNS